MFTDTRSIVYHSCKRERRFNRERLTLTLDQISFSKVEFDLDNKIKTEPETVELNVIGKSRNDLLA